MDTGYYFSHYPLSEEDLGVILVTFLGLSIPPSLGDWLS
jgi:hypothetical protein